MSAPDAALGPAADPGARGFTGAETMVRIVAGVAILLLWEAVVRLWAPAFVARPSGIAAAIPGVLSSGAFWQAAGETLGAVARGLAIAFVAGTLIGVAMGRLRLFDRVLQVYVNGFFAMPMVAILPLLTLWFGYTGEARLATVVFAAIFAIIVNVADGARSVPPEYHRGLALVPRRRAGRALFDVILPASVPYLLAGLRLAAGRALIGAVVAEFFTADRRARLLHPLQLARLSPQRGLRRRRRAGARRRVVRSRAAAIDGALPAVVPPRRARRRGHGALVPLPLVGRGSGGVRR